MTGQIPDSVDIPAYNGSFNGNSGLCSRKFMQFDPCIRTSDSSIDFLTRTRASLVFIGCFLFVKSKMTRDDDLRCQNPLKQESWNMRPYRVLTFTKEEIVRWMRRNWKCLRTGEQLAVKHILRSVNSSYGFARSSMKCSSAMLTNTNSRPTEFDTEIAVLSSIRHVNVVKLYCSITSEDSYFLVYEYLPNGSLLDRLHSSSDKDMMTAMDWTVRYEIALGTARGLEYLHRGCAQPTIHSDVRSSNILLDENWKTRIADFGLAKIMHTYGGGDWTHAITGTPGYISPEYAYTTKISEKNDVYSFGVVLMKLVTGKWPIKEFGEGKGIVFWVTSRVSREVQSMVEILDPLIKGGPEIEDVVKVLQADMRCTAKFPALRPSMRTVVQMLEEIDNQASSSSLRYNSW